MPQDGVRRNELIRAREVRVIAADGEQLGILQRNDAIALAKEAGMDLVEVASTSEPPVCRIMDYGKFKYEQQKKKQEAKKRQSVVQIKEIKVRPKTDDHDYETKIRHIRRFLEDGDRCKITVFFRGREIVHKDRGMTILERVVQDLADVAKGGSRAPRRRPHAANAAGAQVARGFAARRPARGAENRSGPCVASRFGGIMPLPVSARPCRALFSARSMSCPRSKPAVPRPSVFRRPAAASSSGAARTCGTS